MIKEEGYKISTPSKIKSLEIKNMSLLVKFLHILKWWLKFYAFASK